jgi:hypothetical protein
VKELWAELAKKVAERWLTLLVLPGLLYVGAAGAGRLLGHRHWHDTGRLRHRVDVLAGGHPQNDLGVVLLVATAVLLAAATAGLAAQGLGRIAERLAMGQWPVGPLTTWRRRRWLAAKEAHATAVREKARLRLQDKETGRLDTDRLNAARNRVSLVEPAHPTWMADRMRAVDQRVHQTYDLDLASAWPRLWLVIPDVARDELREARDGFGAGCRLTGWGVLYLGLGLCWWPAAVIGMGTILTGWRRSRAAIGGYADLVESTVDLYGRDLARALGLDCEGALTPRIGVAITERLRKGI